MTAVNILCYLVICVTKFGHRLESNSTSQLFALSSLQNTGRFVEVGAFDKWGSTEVPPLVG